MTVYLQHVRTVQSFHLNCHNKLASVTNLKVRTTLQDPWFDFSWNLMIVFIGYHTTYLEISIGLTQQKSAHLSCVRFASLHIAITNWYVNHLYVKKITYSMRDWCILQIYISRLLLLSQLDPCRHIWHEMYCSTSRPPTHASSASSQNDPFVTRGTTRHLKQLRSFCYFQQ